MALGWIKSLMQSSSSLGAAFERERLSKESYELIYAIGDVHGRLDLLLKMERAILEDAQGRAGSRAIVLVGDYVDRGPRSAQVLDWILAPPPGGWERIALAGNHEAMMLNFCDDPTPGSDWLANGGIDTLVSYGLPYERIREAGSSRRALGQLIDAVIPKEHVALLRDLPVSLSVPGYTFVHAGLERGRSLAAHSDHELLWHGPRAEPDFDFVVVHGHTTQVEASISTHRIGLDTGAFATGRLSAVRLQQGFPPARLVVE